VIAGAQDMTMSNS